MFVRGGASCASAFQKITFTFTSGAGNAVYKGFPPTITPVSTFIYPSPILHPRMTGEAPEPLRTWRVKDRWRFCIPFAPAGNAREPLFTGTFSLRGEGEGFFKKTIVVNSFTFFNYLENLTNSTRSVFPVEMGGFWHFLHAFVYNLLCSYKKLLSILHSFVMNVYDLLCAVSPIFITFAPWNKRSSSRSVIKRKTSFSFVFRSLIRNFAAL
jgi:hypothetical protein